MGSTSRFGLHYPDLTDAPNGPAQFQQLAEDADGWLCRAFPCTSGSRPSGVAAGFLVRESDSGNVMVWTGSAWAQVAGAVSGGGGGGGGGGTPAIGTVSATYAASSAQSISSSADVVVAFGTALTTDSSVVRSTSGAGHSFTLQQTRLWTITATCRFAAHTDSGGRTFELRAGSTVLAKEGDAGHSGAAWTRSLAACRSLPSGTVVTLVARQDSGASISLDPSGGTGGGNTVHIDLAGV